MESVHVVELQLESGNAITKSGLLSGEGVGVNFPVDADIEKAVLLIYHQRQLPLNLALRK